MALPIDWLAIDLSKRDLVLVLDLDLDLDPARDPVRDPDLREPLSSSTYPILCLPPRRATNYSSSSTSSFIFRMRSEPLRLDNFLASSGSFGCLSRLAVLLLPVARSAYRSILPELSMMP